MEMDNQEGIDFGEANVNSKDVSLSTKNNVLGLKNYLHKYRRLIIIFALVILIVSIGIPVTLLNCVSKEERYAIENTKNLKKLLNDPDSLKLYNDIMVIEYTDLENRKEIYTYIDFGAANSYGGINRDTAVYVGYTYAGTFEDIGEKIDINNEKFPYDRYESHGLEKEVINGVSAGVDKCTFVDVNKVMRHVK